MKLKNFLLLILICGTYQTSFSQLTQADTTSVYQSIIPSDKQDLLSNVDLIANMQFAHFTDWEDGDWLASRFRMEQFRFEARGYITKKLYFRFRHRYTDGFDPQSVDKIIKKVDFAYLNIKLDPKWSLTLGKMSGNLGGIEFDLNPINIYQYSDIINNLDNFLSGVAARYQVSEKHAFTLQLLNSRTQSAEEIYGEDFIIGGELEPAKAPWASVINWQGTLLDGKLITRWHYAIYNEGKSEYQNYITLGQQLNLDQWSISYDYKLSMEDIDRTGVIRKLISTPDRTITLRDTRYESHWLSVQHRLNPKWQLSLTAFVDFASVKNEQGDYEKVRNAYSYIPAVEFFPFEDYNLKFYVNYVGRVYRHTPFAEDVLNLTNSETGRLSFGLISPLKFL